MPEIPQTVKFRSAVHFLSMTFGLRKKYKFFSLLFFYFKAFCVVACIKKLLR